MLSIYWWNVNGNGASIYLHDLRPFCCCCCWWSFPIFTIISLPTLLLHDKDSIEKASCSAAADDEEVGDGNCCGCEAWGGFWFLPQTLNGFCAFVGSISANNTDILVGFYFASFFPYSLCCLSLVLSSVHVHCCVWILPNCLVNLKLFVGFFFRFNSFDITQKLLSATCFIPIGILFVDATLVLFLFFSISFVRYFYLSKLGLSISRLDWHKLITLFSSFFVFKLCERNEIAIDSSSGFFFFTT